MYKLNKPYNQTQKNNFLSQYNRKQNLRIEETDIALYALEPWEILENDEVISKKEEWDIEQLNLAKERKYQEANLKANEFLQSGNALYEFEENKHIEATDGNIAKMTAYALAYVTGQLQPEDTVVWNTKEDETVELNQAQIVSILQGLGQVQAVVWSVKYPAYVKAIGEAQTIEEVEEIEIDYTMPEQEPEDEKNS